MTSALSWPHCLVLGDTCLAYRAGTSLGSDALLRLFEFIANAREGSRLTLQRDRNDFILQVTEETRIRGGESIHIDHLRMVAGAHHRKHWASSGRKPVEEP